MMVHDDGVYKCLTCGKYGTDLRVIMRKVDRGYNFSAAKKVGKLLPRWRSWEAKYGGVGEIAQRAHRFLKEFPPHAAFFKRRKIDQFINQGLFGYLDGWNLFPILDREGKVLDIVVRSSPGLSKKAPKYVLHPDKDRESPYLYVPNWHAVMGSKTLYVPFGMVDAWALWDIGAASVTGTAGKFISDQLLKDLVEEMDFQSVIFVPDKDEEREAYRLANKLGWRADVLILDYPSDCKDPDEIRVRHGKDILKEMIGGYN